MKLDERKQAVLSVMERLGRSIWIGDVSNSASDQSSFRLALHALINEGKIVPQRQSRAGRVYYRLAVAPALPTKLQACNASGTDATVARVDSPC
jgi:hypothetical protein